MEKKAKAEAKRTRRIKRKQGDDAGHPPERPNFGPETLDVESNPPDIEPITPHESN